jgi:hypothetical protein
MIFTYLHKKIRSAILDLKIRNPTYEQARTPYIHAYISTDGSTVLKRKDEKSAH